jgi:hypothetical protein
MIENWRIWVIVILMTLSLTDLVLTGYYVHKYKTWQPEKEYKLMELNPLLVFLWNNLGFWLGHIIGSVIILSLVFIVGKLGHPIIIILIGLFFLYAIFGHFTNIGLLKELIIKYPNGAIPKDFLK